MKKYPLLEKYLRSRIRKSIMEQQEVTNQAAAAESPAVFNALGSVLATSAGNINSAISSDPELKKELETVNIGQTQTNEALGMIAAGGILSLGKLAELAGNGLASVGKRVGGDEKNMLSKVGNWLHGKGHAYTHGIENIIIKTLEKIPATSKFIATLDQEQKDLLAKTILTSIVGVLAISSGVGTVKALLSGENVLATIEGLLTGTKSAEIQANFPKIVKGILKQVVDSSTPQV